jgi:hypothetical protein
MAHRLGQQAVVIGGSLAGLLTARVLADHFDAVTVLERDYIDARPGIHKSIPQGNHVHGLLLSGQQVMASLYPSFHQKLHGLGAMRCRANTELAFYPPTGGKAFSATGTVREPHDLGFDITCHSRGLLEYCVRQCTLEHTKYRNPTSVLRHYERLTTFPEGFMVLGDAISNFNPIYGQGMSAAALQVEALQQLLRECVMTSQGLAGLAQAFFPKAAAIVLTPWTLAANQDLAYPRTQGERPADLAQGAQYFAALDALTAEDVEVYRLLVEVAHLVKPLAALHEEPLRSRVLARQQQQRGK